MINKSFSQSSLSQPSVDARQVQITSDEAMLRAPLKNVASRVIEQYSQLSRVNGGSDGTYNITLIFPSSSRMSLLQWFTPSLKAPFFEVTSQLREQGYDSNARYRESETPLEIDLAVRKILRKIPTRDLPYYVSR